jgi:transcriptional regulator with XRE-family HTH domain
MESMTISAEQCRAGRAILGWSQDDLENHSGVGKRTIAEFERDGAIPYARTISQVRDAQEAGGIEFIPENGGGAGVRRRKAVPRLARKKISRFDRMATLIIAYRASEFIVELPTEILDDMDRVNHETDAKLEASLSHHMNKVLLTAAIAIDAGRAGNCRHLVLTQEDFSDVL